MFLVQYNTQTILRVDVNNTPMGVQSGNVGTGAQCS